jgi:hypothetical protein
MFERMCLTNGISVLSYMSDNSTAFSLKEFVREILNCGQDTCHSAVGAQHHNRVAKRSVLTFSNMVRTIMLYAVVHWSDLADSSLWPQAMEYTAYMYKHM